MSAPNPPVPELTAAESAAAVPPATPGRSELMEALLESVFDGVLIVSGDGRMMYHNQNFLDIWDFPASIIESRSDEAALAWAAAQTDDAENFLRRVNDVYENRGQRVREELRMKDGRILERCGSQVQTGESPLPWMWTFRDITERRQSEQTIRRSEQRYRTLFDSIDDGFCVIEIIEDAAGRPLDYRFLEVNPAFERQSGLVDAVGRTMRSFAPAHEDFWFDFYGKVARSRQPDRVEHHAVELHRWFSAYAFPVDAPEQLRVGVLFSDVTARIAAARALQASEQFNRAVMESSPDCIKVIDRDGRLLSMNTAGLCILEIDDFTPHANQRWSTLWSEDTRGTVQDSIDRALRGETVRFQAMNPTAKGTVKWWDVAVAPIAPETPGAPIERLISVSRDISEIKRGEADLQRARAQAEAASRAKDHFLAALSHELRTPLNPVLLTASSLSEDPTLPAAVREQLRMIERNISLEARLIDDLLDLTRIARGKLPLRTEPCDIHTLLGLVVEMVREDAREKRIEIHLDLGATRSGMNGDPARLQQVYWNLLRNAVKFTPPGGRVDIRSRDDAPAADGTRLRVEVADTGIGIPADALDVIFEPFEQAQRDRDEALGGLGLGLAIAKAIVELHHGTLRVESAGPHRGATFIVESPSEPPPDPQSSASLALSAADDQRPEVPLRLLVVEDHAATLQVLARLLTRAGHTVVTATSLAAARKAAAAQEFHGLISDVGLPDGTGIELMEELRATYGMRGIVLSGYGMEDDLRRSRDVGFIAHLVKPVNITELRRQLRRLAPGA